MIPLYILICYSLLFTCQGYDFPTRKNTKSKMLSFGYMDLKQPEGTEQDDFNALHDLDGTTDYALNTYSESLFEDNGRKFQNHKKKSDSRPKYDPGWKFIGLGKRPEINGLRFAPEFYSKDRVNPFLGLSTLINFEFINALRDGIEDDTKDTVKKESTVSSEEDMGSYRFNKMNVLGSRRKSMYDPGWMLTGLGK